MLREDNDPSVLRQAVSSSTLHSGLAVLAQHVDCMYSQLGGGWLAADLPAGTTEYHTGLVSCRQPCRQPCRKYHCLSTNHSISMGMVTHHHHPCVIKHQAQQATKARVIVLLMDEACYLAVFNSGACVAGVGMLCRHDESEQQVRPSVPTPDLLTLTTMGSTATHLVLALISKIKLQSTLFKKFNLIIVISV